MRPQPCLNKGFKEFQNILQSFEQKSFANFSKSIFTSMFVERMEVLEYRQKFEVELSTFPDSTNTKTPRKLVFSLTCVCLSVCPSVCLSVCAKKFVSGYLTRELTDLDENYGVCCNWRRIENLPYPVQLDHYFPLIRGGGWFLQFLEPLYLGNNKRYRKTEKTLST